MRRIIVLPLVEVVQRVRMAMRNLLEKANLLHRSRHLRPQRLPLRLQRKTNRSFRTSEAPKRKPNKKGLPWGGGVLIR